MKRPEEQLQRSVVQYLQTALPRDVFWFSCPNQRGTRERWEMGLLKSMGVRAGVPDICVVWKGRFIGIELKSKRGTLSAAQDLAGREITLAGGLYNVCRSIEDVHCFLRVIGMDLRGNLVSAKLSTGS